MALNLNDVLRGMLKEAQDLPERRRCVECNEPLGGVLYGAGDGTGQRFRCGHCHWMRKSLLLQKVHNEARDRLVEALLSINLMIQSGRFNAKQQAELHGLRTALLGVSQKFKEK